MLAGVAQQSIVIGGEQIAKMVEFFHVRTLPPHPPRQTGRTLLHRAPKTTGFRATGHLLPRKSLYRSLSQTFGTALMRRYEVSSRVNVVKNDDAACATAV